VSTAFELALAAENKEVKGMWTFARMLRGRLCDELSAEATPPGSPGPVAHLLVNDVLLHERDNQDNFSRHALGRSAARSRACHAVSAARLTRACARPPSSPLSPRPVGDAPVVTLRWRPVEAAVFDAPLGGVPVVGVVALIDRFFVMPFYRRRRYGRTSLLNCLVDILQNAAARSLPVSRVSVLLPEEPRLARKLLEPLATIIQNTAAKSLQYECISTVCVCV
jgi:GNAT superfamily N-acetyltransferase